MIERWKVIAWTALFMIALAFLVTALRVVWTQPVSERGPPVTYVVGVQEVKIVSPEPMITLVPSITPTKYPSSTPLPTWQGQSDGGLYQRLPNTPTPFPPRLTPLCIHVRAVTTGISCFALPFTEPGLWFD